MNKKMKRELERIDNDYNYNYIPMYLDMLLEQKKITLDDIHVDLNHLEYECSLKKIYNYIFHKENKKIAYISVTVMTPEYMLMAIINRKMLHNKKEIMQYWNCVYQVMKRIIGTEYMAGMMYEFFQMNTVTSEFEIKNLHQYFSAIRERLAKNHEN